MSLKKNLTRVALLAAVVASVSSCTNEDLMFNPQLEAYNRSFIKEFGKIDPEQDWNMAQEAKVTLNLGSRTAESVKVYSKYENTYYIVADLINLSGQINVPIDIPQSSTDIMVRVDGTEYFGTINSEIDCTNGGRQSRQLIDTGILTGGGIHD